MVTYDGGNGGDRGHAITIDSSANIYVAGQYDGGPDNDWIVLKYDGNGDLATGSFRKTPNGRYTWILDE
jgi:hypothetical protein